MSETDKYEEAVNTVIGTALSIDEQTADAYLREHFVTRDEADKYRIMLLDLLAVIHRDGGHKTQEIGIALAHEQALRLSAERIVEAKELATITAERDRLRAAFYSAALLIECLDAAWRGVPVRNLDEAFERYGSARQALNPEDV